MCPRSRDIEELNQSQRTCPAKKKNPTRSSHGLKGADADAFEAELNNKKIQKSVHGFISHFFFVDWVCPS